MKIAYYLKYFVYYTIILKLKILLAKMISRKIVIPCWLAKIASTCILIDDNGYPTFILRIGKNKAIGYSMLAIGIDKCVLEPDADELVRFCYWW